jgi:peptidoglycan/xylan/chitin deacetylase (PgdA/CDA1 family)
MLYRHSCPPRKLAAARLLGRTLWSRVAELAEAHYPFTRVFNYHGTPPRFRDSFARQLDFLLRRYRGRSAFELERILANGPGDRSVALFSFDDGLANNLEVAAPLLEERGLRGIFCIPADFPSVPAAYQPSWFRERVRSKVNEAHLTDDDLRSLTWDELAELARRGHRICSHSRSHERIDARTPAPILRREIVESRAILESKLPGVVVDGFCWPFRFDPKAVAADALARETYAYALCDDTRPLFGGTAPHRVRRTNVEASWSVDVVALQVSGFIDAGFMLKRIRHALR